MATQQDKTKRIIEASFPDNRVPSSYQGRRNDSQYKQTDFNLEIDERPTRERPVRQAKDTTQAIQGGKENQRNLINIDENEDTFTNQQDFERIFERGEKLRQQMN